MKDILTPIEQKVMDSYSAASQRNRLLYSSRYLFKLPKKPMHASRKWRNHSEYRSEIVESRFRCCMSQQLFIYDLYILAVTLPIFVTDTLHARQQQIGLVMTVFIISTVILRPLTGKWMDEWNRKKIISFSLVLFMICTAIYPFIHQYGLLLGLRFFMA